MCFLYGYHLYLRLLIIIDNLNAVPIDNDLIIQDIIG